MNNFTFYVTQPSIGRYIFLDRDWLNIGDKIYMGTQPITILEKEVVSEQTTCYGINIILCSEPGMTFTLKPEINEEFTNRSITINININLCSS